jgi:hypothetical protein
MYVIRFTPPTLAAAAVILGTAPRLADKPNPDATPAAAICPQKNAIAPKKAT